MFKLVHLLVSICIVTMIYILYTLSKFIFLRIFVRMMVMAMLVIVLVLMMVMMMLMVM